MVYFKNISIFLWIFIFALLGLFILFFWKRDFIIKPDQLFTLKTLPPSNYSAWVPSWDLKRAMDSLSNSGHKLKYISPVWYELQKDGDIKMIEGMNLPELKEKTKEQGVILMPSVFNSFDPERVSLMINNQVKKQAAIEDLVKIAEENQYSGWDLDFEELKLADKDAFSEFVKDLAKSLHQKGLLLSVSVHVQKGDSSDRESAKAQDWAVLGKEADYIRIMAYDFHNSQTGPGPVTPIDDLKQVLKRAINLIPPEKIVLGLPLYGYDWIQGGQGEPIDYQTMKTKTGKLNINLIRDKNSQSLTAKYNEKNINHAVFIEDSVSVLYKINLAKEFGIYQFIFWRLGGEDLSLWVNLP